MDPSELLKRLEQRLPLLDELWTLMTVPAPSSFLSLLKSEISRETAHKVQSELRSATESLSEEIASLANEAKSIKSMLLEETFELRESLSDLKSRFPDVQDSQSTLSSSLSSLHSDLYSLRSDLDQKPSHRDLSKLSEKLLTFASQTDLETIEISLQNCVEKEEMKHIEERMDDLKADLAEYITTDKAESMVDRLEKTVKEWIAPLATATALRDAQSSLLESIDKEKVVFEEYKRQITSEFAVTKREAADIRSVFDSQPWKKDYSFLLDELGKKASRIEIRQFKEDGNAVMQATQLKLREVTETLSEYDSVLQHYDEVLLLKASRDDIKALALRFDSSIDTSGIKSELIRVISDVETIQDDVSRIEDGVGRDRERLEEVLRNQTAVLGRKDALIDPGVVFGSLSDLRDMVTAKADKTDVYNLRDLKCDKQEIGLISGDVHTLKKQLESLAGTLYAFIKGYVDEESSWLLAEKQKTHLLGHSLSLLNWISGSDSKPQPEEIESPSRPRTRTLSTRKKATLSSSLPQVTFSTPKTRPKSRKDSKANIISPSKTLLESMRW